MPKPTTFRFDDEFLQVLDALAEWRHQTTGYPTSRADAVKYAVKELGRPAGGPPAQGEYRRIHRKYFPGGTD